MPFSFLSRTTRELCAACARSAQQTALTRESKLPRSFSPSVPSRRRISTAAPLTPLRNCASPTPSSRRHLSAPSRHPAPAAPEPTTTTHATPSPSPSPPPPPPYYALFPRTLAAGPPPAGPFALDARALRREFLALQAGAHPDRTRHAGGPGGGGGGDELSARLNAAYATLASPLLRAQYLARELWGVDLAEDASGEEQVEGWVLGAVMEAYEVLEGAGGEGELEGLRGENEGRIGESVEALGGLFARGDREGVVKEARRLRYWVNVREAIAGWEGPGKGGRVEH